MKVIVINGPMGVGKTTAGKAIADRVYEPENIRAKRSITNMALLKTVKNVVTRLSRSMT